MHARIAGLATLVAAALAVVVGPALAFLPPSGDPGSYAYPSSPPVHVGFQVFSALQHLAIAGGLLAVVKSGAVGRSRLGSVAGWIAAVSMALLAVTDAVAAPVGHLPVAATLPVVLTIVYALLTVVLGVALVLLGAAVLRARIWTGWWRAVVLVAGIWVFVPLIPALGFGFVTAQLALAAWMLLFVAMGAALAYPSHSRAPRRVSPSPRPRSST